MSDPFDNFSDDDLFAETNATTASPLPANNRYSQSYDANGFTSLRLLNARYSITGGKSNSFSQSMHPGSLYSSQAPPLYPQYQSSSILGTMTGESEYYKHSHTNSISNIPRSRGVTFKESEPEYPATIYSPKKQQLLNDINQFELERFETYDSQGNLNPNMNSGGLRPYSQLMTFTGDDYLINPLKEADEDDDLDPFGDDDSLFSDTGEEIIRRGTTIKRNGTLGRKGTRKDGTAFFDDGEDDFKPRLNYTKTIKKVKLVHGNYVIDAPVPKALLDTFGKKINDGGQEMAFLRYSAVTCGPSNFIKYKYNLRQALYAPPRETEILVCITMYNEDEILLGKTLLGVFENIKNLTNRADPVWGEESWKKIVICIINDGRMELNKRTEILLSSLGLFQEGYAKSKINNKSVKAHLYEYTTTVGIDKVNDRVHLCNNSTPVQMIFCLKEKNGRKINSHRWCFQALAPILNPRVVLLLDCGTKPSKDAFYYLWRSFRDPRVAGACGEMRASLGHNRRLLANPLVAAQNFEYKISNILDKPMESVFGFISVLPGAFSAYRWEALLNVDGKGPLEKYFKGEFLHSSTQIKPKKVKIVPEEASLTADPEIEAMLAPVKQIEVDDDDEDDEREIKERNFHEAGIFTSNMYLAEDRILCFELVAKKDHDYILKYVNEAKAETDVPEQIDDFILQRRRWLNGSLFAAAYAVFHWTKIWKSNHSLLRKLWLQLEFYYQLITIIVSWFSVACFFLVFRILTANLGSSEMNFSPGKYLSVIFLWLYAASVVCTFVLAFGNTPRGTKRFYQVISVFFAVMMVYMMFAAIYLAVKTVTSLLDEFKDDFQVVMVFTNQKFRDLVVSMVSTYVLYFVGAFLYGEPSFMFTSFVQYVLLSPTYVNVLNIYAYANIHDVSWGTRDIPQPKDLGAAKSTLNKDELVMIAPGISEELDESYLNNLESLRVSEPIIEPIINKKKKDDTYYAFIRSMTVLVWMLTNAILICIVLEAMGIDLLTGHSGFNLDGSIGANSQTFLSIILWIVAGLACFRFIGCVLFLIIKSLRPLKWRLLARKQRKQAASG